MKKMKTKKGLNGENLEKNPRKQFYISLNLDIIMFHGNLGSDMHELLRKCKNSFND